MDATIHTEKPQQKILRLFVAVPLWGEFRSQTEQYLRQLKQHSWDLRWVDPVNWHLTLRFLGDVPETSVAGLVHQISTRIRETLSFPITLGGLSGFPRLSRARVLWVPVTEGVEPLNELAREVENGCMTAGYPGDKKPFAAHLTLARTKDEPIKVSVAPEVCNQVWGTVRVEQINIVSSVLNPGGPVYKVLESLLLQPDHPGISTDSQ